MVWYFVIYPVVFVCQFARSFDTVVCFTLHVVTPFCHVVLAVIVEHCNRACLYWMIPACCMVPTSPSRLCCLCCFRAAYNPRYTWSVIRVFLPTELLRVFVLTTILLMDVRTCLFPLVPQDLSCCPMMLGFEIDVCVSNQLGILSHVRRPGTLFSMSTA